jgi:hypothetical protein
MCKEKENDFVGEYSGLGFKTRLDVNGNKIEENNVLINIKIEKIGVGAYKIFTNFNDNLIIDTYNTLGFIDKNNTLVSETDSGSGFIYIYFDGNKLRHKLSVEFSGNKVVRVSKLKRVTYNDCSCHHGHHGNCGCKH